MKEYNSFLVSSDLNNMVSYLNQDIVVNLKMQNDSSNYFFSGIAKLRGFNFFSDKEDNSIPNSLSIEYKVDTTSDDKNFIENTIFEHIIPSEVKIIDDMLHVTYTPKMKLGLLDKLEPQLPTHYYHNGKNIEILKGHYDYKNNCYRLLNNSPPPEAHFNQTM